VVLLLREAHELLQPMQHISRKGRKCAGLASESESGRILGQEIDVAPLPVVRNTERPCQKAHCLGLSSLLYEKIPVGAAKRGWGRRGKCRDTVATSPPSELAIG
jgi:hypothetical protein